MMDSLISARSQKQESDSAAERRWENEGGNPEQLQQLPSDDGKKQAIARPTQARLKAFRYKANHICT
jgi:hypothetical protein